MSIAIRLVRDLGGAVASASTSGEDVLPVDVSFGVGEPLVVVAPPASVARMRLELVLPSFLEDARDVVQACRLQPPSRRSKHDPLTGLLSRRALLAPLSEGREPRDLLLVGLDELPAEHLVDGAVRWLARSTVAVTGEADLAARWDQRRLVVCGSSTGDLEAVAHDLRDRWDRHRPVATTVSGVVVRAEDGASASGALARGTAALRQAARDGGGRVQVLADS